MKPDSPSKRTLSAIFLVGLSSLTLELILTKIFSVTMYHHFAFLSISIALFGLGASGIFVTVFPQWFQTEDIENRLVWISLLYTVSVTFCFALHLQVPFTPWFNLKALTLLGLKFLLIAIPFFFSGLCLALTLKAFPDHAGRVYFADLTGAGLGCLAVIPILSEFGGSSSVILVSIICCIASALFFLQHKKKIFIPLSVLLVLVLLLVYNHKFKAFHIDSVSSMDKSKIVYQDWNPFSRIAVYDLKEKKGLLSTTSSRFNGSLPKWKFIEIDSTAGSHLLDFSKGNLMDFEYLKYDVTFLSYHLAEEDGKVLIIGPGGGRDVLAAKIFGQKEIYGVEVNPIMIDIVEEVFSDFSGNLYSTPNVHIVVDEARSYLSRSDETFDSIQVPFACTWASSAAGSFVLTENSLYTKEAFSLYLGHLKDNGILSMTMWFRGLPGEMLRLVSLGLSGLKELQIESPGEHIIVIMNKKGVDHDSAAVYGYSTFLLKKSPFSTDEVKKIIHLCDQLAFDIYYAPGYIGNLTFHRLIHSADSEAFTKSFILDISPPVDDRPFFFYLLRFGDFWKAFKQEKTFNKALAGNEFHFHIVFILIALLFISITFSLLFLIGPLFFTVNNNFNSIPYLLFFSFIGLGFILIEIPLLQRFSLFLGKPIYSLAVILFTLLVFSGIGSYLTSFFNLSHCRKKLSEITFLLVVLLLFYAFYLPVFLKHFIGLLSISRITISILLLIPLGILMGMPFPIGIRLANEKSMDIIPWAWGINGAASVLSSVIAIILAINMGFTVTMIVGVFFYFCALILVRHFI